MRGFTLIELLVVVAIIGLLVGIGIPSFIGFRNEQTLNSARGEVMNLLQTAKAYSNLNVKPATCNGYTLASYKVVITASNNYALDVTCTGRTPPDVILKSASLPASVVFTTAVNTAITFTILHGNISGNSFVLKNNADGSTKTITVDSLGDITSN